MLELINSHLTAYLHSFSSSILNSLALQHSFPSLIFSFLLSCHSLCSGAQFEDSDHYVFANPAVPVPISEEDLRETSLPTPKIRMAFPGLVGTVEPLADALLAAGLYSDALRSFRLRLSGLLLMGTTCQAPAHRAAVAYTTYKLSLALFMRADYAGCAQALRHYLVRNPKYEQIAGRMMTLLMSAELLGGDTMAAMQYYDAAQDVYNFCLGAFHPIHSVHMSTLGDLYCQIDALAGGAGRQARVMATLAYEMSLRAAGEKHLVTAGYAKKLGLMCLQDGDYRDAAHLLNDAVLVFNFAYAQGIHVQKQVADCLHALAVAHSRLNEIGRAAMYGKRSIACAATVDDRFAPPEVVACMLLLAEVYTRKKETDTAVSFLLHARNVVRSRPAEYINPGAVLSRLTHKLLFHHYHMLSMPTRKLLDDVEKESIQEIIPHVAARLEMKARIHYLHDIRSDAWESACETIFDGLWDQPPAELFSDIIHRLKIQEGSLSSGIRNFLCAASNDIKMLV